MTATCSLERYVCQPLRRGPLFETPNASSER
jgi:hypothetical protein